MVLVTMSDQDTAYAVFLITQVARIGDNQVYTIHLIVREHHPGVNNHYVVAILNDDHILSDFSQPSQRDDSDFICCQGTKNLLTTSKDVALL